MGEKIYEFDPQVYQMKLWVMKKPDFETVQKTFYSMEEEDELYEFESKQLDLGSHTTMRVFPVVKKETNQWGILAFFGNPKYFKPSILAHEASHVCDWLFELIGINRGKFDDGEPAAYFIQWVFEQLYNVKKGKV